MSTVAQDLAGTSALDDNAAKVTVGSFYADRRAVVVMIRYFDSASCRKIVTSLRDAQSEIEKRGAQLVVIGASQPNTMAEFRESVGYHGPLVVDPSLDAFRAAGMVAGAAPMPASARAAAPAAHAPAEPSGFFGKMKAALNVDVVKLAKMDLGQALTVDLVKLGSERDADPGAPAPAGGGSAPAAPTSSHDAGVFILGPGAVASYEWRSGKAGELPKLSDLIAALPKK